MSKKGKYQRKRAMEMAHRDWLSGKSIKDNPFPIDTAEHKIWNKHFFSLKRGSEIFEDTCKLMGCDTSQWTRRSPDSVTVRDPWPGCF